MYFLHKILKHFVNVEKILIQKWRNVILHIIKIKIELVKFQTKHEVYCYELQIF